MKDPLIKARNGVHLNQVDTIAFGVGVRKVCWPDAYFYPSGAVPKLFPRPVDDAKKLY